MTLSAVDSWRRASEMNPCGQPQDWVSGRSTAQIMGIQHLLLLLIYLDPLNVLCAATANKKKNAPKRNQKMKEVNGTEAPTAVPRRNTQVQAPSIATHDTCLGYYDVSGAYDKVFECNNTEHRYCCGSCFLRYCCAEKGKRIEQKTCTNYNTPDWIKTQPPTPAPTGDTYDPDLDQTNTTVYITCGVIAFIILIGVSAKVAYDKATKPPQEMNVHRALADILRQQGLNKENENIAALEGSPKDIDTPLRTSKNHYTPVHTMLANHGHYGKENFRQGQLDHNFISSGFVTLGRPHLKAQHSVDDLGQLSWQGDQDVPNISYSVWKCFSLVSGNSCNMWQTGRQASAGSQAGRQAARQAGRQASAGRQSARRVQAGSQAGGQAGGEAGRQHSGSIRPDLSLGELSLHGRETAARGASYSSISLQPQTTGWAKGLWVPPTVKLIELVIRGVGTSIHPEEACVCPRLH